MIILRYVGAFLFFLLSTPSIAQSQLEIENLQQKVDSMFQDRSDGVHPGSAILIVKNKNLILNKGYGIYLTEIYVWKLFGMTHL